MELRIECGGLQAGDAPTCKPRTWTDSGLAEGRAHGSLAYARSPGQPLRDHRTNLRPSCWACRHSHLTLCRRSVCASRWPLRQSDFAPGRRHCATIHSLLLRTDSAVWTGWWCSIAFSFLIPQSCERAAWIALPRPSIAFILSAHTVRAYFSQASHPTHKRAFQTPAALL